MWGQRLNDNRFDNIRKSLQTDDAVKAFAESDAEEQVGIQYMCVEYPHSVSAAAAAATHYVGPGLKAVLAWAEKVTEETGWVLVETKTNGAVFRNSYEVNTKERVDLIVRIIENNDRIAHLESELASQKRDVDTPFDSEW